MFLSLSDDFLFTFFQMGNPNTIQNEDNKQVLITEFNVSMHCNACERSVAKAISKIKGVEKFVTDMPRQRVVVTGQINPEEVVKKIKKKTGKKARILARKEDKKGSKKEEGLPSQETQDYVMETFGFDCCLTAEGYTIFSDENPNACSIM